MHLDLHELRDGLQEGDAVLLGGDVLRDLRVAVVPLHKPVQDAGHQFKIGVGLLLNNPGGGRRSEIVV